MVCVNVCVPSDFVLLTDGNSKSFWLTRLRKYSIRYRFSGQANCTGGVRLLIAVTMVCHKHRKSFKRKKIHSSTLNDSTTAWLALFTKSSKNIWGYFNVFIGYEQRNDTNTATYLYGLFDIILDVLNFLLFLSEKQTKVNVRYYCCTASTYTSKSVVRINGEKYKESLGSTKPLLRYISIADHDSGSWYTFNWLIET